MNHFSAAPEVGADGKRTDRKIPKSEIGGRVQAMLEEYRQGVLRSYSEQSLGNGRAEGADAAGGLDVCSPGGAGGASMSPAPGGASPPPPRKLPFQPARRVVPVAGAVGF